MSGLDQETLKFGAFLSIQVNLSAPNSHAVGMAVARPLGFEINFVRNPISGSAAWFFIIIL